MAVWQSTRNLLYQSFQSRLWDSCFDCIAFPGGLCYTLLRGLRQSTSGIFGFYVGTTGGFARAFRQSTSGIFGFCTGTTGRLCKALSQATPRIFGFHVGTREGFIIYRLTCFSPFLTCILTCISKKLSRKLGQLAPTFPSKGIFQAKQKSPKSQARSHFSGILLWSY